VTTLAFSPDGKKLVSGAGADALVPGRRHEVRLWDLAGRREIRTLLSGPGGGVQNVAFAPDGKRVAAGTIGGGVHVWDIEDGQQIREFVPSPHQGTIFAVAFAPDGRTLAAGSEAGVITLWDLASKALVRSFTGHNDNVLAVCFSRDGRRLASGGKDTTIRLWDVSEGGLKATLDGHLQRVDQLGFDRTQTRLFSSSTDGTIKVWDATVATHPVAIWGHTGWTNTLSFHPDGKTLASGGWGGIFIWDAASGRRLDTMQSSHYGGPHCIAYSPDGKSLAAVGQSPRVEVWETASKRLLHDIKTKSTACTAVVFSPDCSKLIVGDKAGDVRILDLVTDSEVKVFRAHEDAITGVSLATDGLRLATASPGEIAKVWGLPEGRELLSIKAARSYSWPTAQIAVFDHVGRRLAVRRENHTVAIVDAGTGALLRTLTGHSDEINTMAFSPDDRRLATAGTDKTVRLWDPDRGEEMLTLFGHQASVSGIAWSIDGRYLAAVGVSQGQVWDASPPVDGVRDDGLPHEGRPGHFRASSGPTARAGGLELMSVGVAKAGKLGEPTPY
jgi:WD40 repeat protein